MARKTSASKQPAQDQGDVAVRRRRILEAAFAAFMKEGYAATSTLEIATRARVSKRALYELVGTKQEMLVASISERAKRLRPPADLATPADRDEFARALAAIGCQLMREISDPTVIAVFRLAIAEAVNAPEVAWALDSAGREASRATLREIMTRAHAAGLVTGNPTEMAEQFAGLLWGNLLVSLLLRVVDRPSDHDVTERAQAAAAAFLRLYSEPRNVTVAGSKSSAKDRDKAAAL